MTSPESPIESIAATEKVIVARENPLINLLANVVLPVFVLNKLSKYDPLLALGLALLFPLAYGSWSYYHSRKFNYISVLGLINTLFTGGFALMKLEGIWFAFKEAGFPFLIGCFVFISSFKANPFLGFVLVDTGALATDDIYAGLDANNTRQQFLQLLQKGTFYFSLTFFMSAALNFILAYNIFQKIPKTLTDAAQSEMLNEQIARMTWMGYAVIFVPSVLLFFIIMFFFFRKLGQLTGLKFEKMIKA
jgi:hypothetical protein